MKIDLEKIGQSKQFVANSLFERVAEILEKVLFFFSPNYVNIFYVLGFYGIFRTAILKKMLKLRRKLKKII